MNVAIDNQEYHPLDDSKFMQKIRDEADKDVKKATITQCKFVIFNQRDTTSCFFVTVLVLKWMAKKFEPILMAIPLAGAMKAVLAPMNEFREVLEDAGRLVIDGKRVRFYEKFVGWMEMFGTAFVLNKLTCTIYNKCCFSWTKWKDARLGFEGRNYEDYADVKTKQDPQNAWVYYDAKFGCCQKLSLAFCSIISFGRILPIFDYYFAKWSLETYIFDGRKVRLNTEKFPLSEAFSVYFNSLAFIPCGGKEFRARLDEAIEWADSPATQV
jgi:hypothetical protein